MTMFSSLDTSTCEGETNNIHTRFDTIVSDLFAYLPPPFVPSYTHTSPPQHSTMVINRQKLLLSGQAHHT